MSKIDYEIDFIGVKEADSADAICFRWKKSDGTFGIGVYDGGTRKYSDALCKTLDKVYFKDDEEKYIDFVICSHPDADHAAGLNQILEKFKIGTLYMNRPWNHLDFLIKNKVYGRTTKVSLENKLRQDFQYIDKLEKKAIELEVDIEECFSDTTRRICDCFYVLSPSKLFYLKRVEESSSLLESSTETFSSQLGNETAEEDWETETLHDTVTTSPKNETSVVLFAYMGEDNFLLTGDAGEKSLQNAIETFKRYKCDLKGYVSLYQIPHHGSGNNVTPSLLNNLVGNIRDENDFTDKLGVISAGEKGHHPYKAVVNAFMRRGVNVYVTNGGSLFHQTEGMPQRKNSQPADSSVFYNQVETW